VTDSTTNRVFANEYSTRRCGERIVSFCYQALAQACAICSPETKAISPTPQKYGLRENLVNLLPDLLAMGRLQISHRRFHVRVPQPLLHRAQIDASPE
jgi:hypothetical protein